MGKRNYTPSRQQQREQEEMRDPLIYSLRLIQLICLYPMGCMFRVVLWLTIFVVVVSAICIAYAILMVLLGLAPS